MKSLDNIVSFMLLILGVMALVVSLEHGVEARDLEEAGKLTEALYASNQGIKYLVIGLGSLLLGKPD